MFHFFAVLAISQREDLHYVEELDPISESELVPVGFTVSPSAQGGSQPAAVVSEPVVSRRTLLQTLRDRQKFSSKMRSKPSRPQFSLKGDLFHAMISYR